MAKTAAEHRYVRDLNARLPAGVNRCGACGLFKSEDQFSPTQRWSGSKRKQSYDCRPCAAAKRRRYRAALAPEVKKAQARAANIKNLYGMSENDYLDMVAAQSNTCAICKGSDPKHSSGKWNIDHDHKTGAVRALLCGPCNRGIGKFEDDPARLRAAADYLEAHSAKGS